MSVRSTATSASKQYLQVRGHECKATFHWIFQAQNLGAFMSEWLCRSIGIQQPHLLLFFVRLFHRDLHNVSCYFVRIRMNLGPTSSFRVVAAVDGVVVC